MSVKEIYKYCIFWVLLFVITAGTVSAQQTFNISGKVTDNQGILPGATVFLTGTRELTATNEYGNFKFSKIPPGNYQLIVKMMGFSPFLKSITVAEESVVLNITLQPNIQQLSEVVIKPDVEWFKNLEIFKKQFLGENDNAQKCKILNAERISLIYNKKTYILKASSDDLLIIDNSVLGYRLTYLLANFEYNKSKNIVVYMGYPSFQNLKGTSQQEVAWRANRKLAYQGSVQHFLRSAYNDELKKQGFVVYKLSNWVPGGAGYKNNIDSVVFKRRTAIDTLMSTINKSFKKLTSKNALFVLYLKQGEDENYKQAGYSLSRLYDDKRLDTGQTSVINFLSPGVAVDGKGAFFKPQDLFFEGYMAWQKVSNLTPLGYDPEE
ncbi:MAG: hypothetical protein JWR05_1754 [Mucilaginibacter sp.]|nr:hypothetical protein [Mucilaginibacter sp.]